jgi:catechol 2,3-dioxygenase-like lactoylglutathione lyase family enzyme
MGFHHVALVTRDAAETHRFYTDLMGFELVKVVASPTPGEGDGFSKHFFYSTGASDESDDPGLIAFWDLHDDEIGTHVEDNLNRAAGTPVWVNHIAFNAPTRRDLDAHRRRWTDHGHRVIEVDHGFCVSIYITDPSGNMVEFCHSTKPFDAADRIEAERLLADPHPPLTNDADVTVHEPEAAGV